MQFIPIDQIDIGKRHRKDMGDIEELAASIQSLGLLQPIAINEKSKLIFGERRLRACRDILKHSEIMVRVIDIPSLVAGEHAENEFRKDFTPSERVAIAKALEREIPERRGRSRKVQNFVHLQGKSCDVVAKKAGFHNRETLRQAKKVVANGSPKLVEAMDSKKVAISTAARIADLSTEEQDKLLESECRSLRQSARGLPGSKKKAVSESVSKTAPQNPIPELLSELKNHRDQLAKILSPICGEQDVTMHRIEKRTISRLLLEIEEIVVSLEQAWIGLEIQVYTGS